MKKVFLDTNIFIDFFDETRVNNEQAKQLIYFLISNEIKIVFSEDMISTIAYLIDKNKLPALMSFFKSTITNPYFEIVSFGSSVINMACDFHLQNKGDF
ncbi:PIN domain-containing protein, partial [Campylobacter coli]|nr:PIN domain-containing protein [Campylobacter coli]